MTFRFNIRKATQHVLERLLDFLAPENPAAAPRARQAIAEGDGQLRTMPFGGAGYAALLEIDKTTTATVLAVRHPREDDDD